MLITRTRHFASRLQPQFTRGEVEKRYLVRIQGQPEADEFECTAPISAEPGEVGTRTVDFANGLEARTGFRVLRREADGTTLLEARPLTGRTNQIRVHLWHLGTPVCGDSVYLPQQVLGDTQTLPVGAPPLCLHAWQMRFSHPLTGENVEFTAAAPAWAGEVA
ncbi:MAG: RluA family pseudouridine synthase [Chthoniobacteraceae bacterium]